MTIFDYKVETFLLNLFFIMFPLIFYQFVSKDRIEAKPSLRNALLYSIFMLPIVLCLLMPVNDTDGFYQNLHSVPFIMACLYTNPFVSFLVCVSSMLFRWFIGGQGQYLSYLYDTFSFAFFYFYIRKYRTLRLPVKMVLTFLVSFLSKLTAKVIFYFFIDSDILVNPRLPLNVIEGVFMALALYTIESVLKNMQLKKDLLASERLRVASIISASMAHEIRNPLTSVRGFIQLLSGPTEPPPEKRQFYGKIALEEIDRAQRIITDYLSLSRPYPEVREKIDLGEEIAYVSSVLSSYQDAQNIEVRVEAQENLHILGDRQQLRQCIINLSKNGIESMENGGVLNLKVTRQQDEIVLLIGDTGKGMTPEQINRLGTPYFSNKEKGTGLGTMVSFNIIHNMFGKINVASKVGEGTHFQISFPSA